MSKRPCAQVRRCYGDAVQGRLRRRWISGIRGLLSTERVAGDGDGGHQRRTSTVFGKFGIHPHPPAHRGLSSGPEGEGARVGVVGVGSDGSGQDAAAAAAAARLRTGGNVEGRECCSADVGARPAPAPRGGGDSERRRSSLAELTARMTAAATAAAVQKVRGMFNAAGDNNNNDNDNDNAAPEAM